MSDKFTDAKGREWLLALTYGDVKRIKQITGTNILALVDKPVAQAKADAEDGQPLPVFIELQLDPILLGDVIYALVKPQLTERGVSDDDFSSSIGPAEFKAAKEIFWRLYNNFFLEAGETAQAKMIAGAGKLSEGLEKGIGNMEAEIERALSQLGNPQT